MAKSTKKTKTEVNPVNNESRESLTEYIQDIAQKANKLDESRLHCAIAITQILSNASNVTLLDEENKSTLKEVWQKLKSEGIQLEDPPFLFGLPENFDQEELAN
jgi:hypothetical protein